LLAILADRSDSLAAEIRVAAPRPESDGTRRHGVTRLADLVPRRMDRVASLHSRAGGGHARAEGVDACAGGVDAWAEGV
jgi:hypothetical protein